MASVATFASSHTKLLADEPHIIRHGIFDFRDPARDTTADFDFDADLRLAETIALSGVKTYNQALELYQAAEDRREPRPMPALPLRPDQLAHGPAILSKIPGYLADVGEAFATGGVALENGCGHGMYVDGFARRFETLIVVDISLANVVLAKKMAEERGLTNIIFVCASVEHLPIRDGVIDFLHCNNVIEHVGDQRKLLAEANRVVAPGGLLFVLSPNRMSLYREPHFQLFAFGFIPTAIRRAIIQRTQHRDIANIPLLSLGDLRRLARQTLDAHHIAFLPSKLSATENGGALRALALKMLRLPGGAAVLNKALLGVVPYHALFAVKRR